MAKFINIFKIILLFLIILFIIFFSIMNSEVIKVDLNFLMFSHIVEVRLFLLIIICFSVGFLFGTILSSYKLFLKHIETFKEKRKNKKLQENLEQKQKEINNK